jgi:hypothetical protein
MSTIDNDDDDDDEEMEIWLGFILHPEAQSGGTDPDPHKGREDGCGLIGQGCVSPNSLGC